MNATAVREIVTLATATGMRSFSAPALLAVRAGGPLRMIVPAMALAELAADKTSFVGDRTDPAPLTGRAILGGLVGALVAHRHRASALAGAVTGAAVAVLAAHAAFQLRRRAPVPPMLGGLVEDAVVLGLCASCAARPAAR